MAGDRGVLVVGDIMRDVIVRPEGPLRHGTDTRAAITTHFGGSAASQAAWLARFGVRVRLAACVAAAERHGHADRLLRQGIEPALTSHPTLPTGTVVAMVDRDGERSFMTDRGANDALAFADLPAGLWEGIGHLHLSSYAFVGEASRATVLALVEEAHRRGVPISLDPGSAAFVEELGPETLTGPLRGAALCVANAAEAKALTGVEGDGQLVLLADLFGLAIVKRGAAGAVARDRAGATWAAEAPAVAVVDTTGAGDVFFAAFLSARFEGYPVGEALSRAVAAGSNAVTIVGGWPLG